MSEQIRIRITAGPEAVDAAADTCRASLVVVEAWRIPWSAYQYSAK